MLRSYRPNWTEPGYHGIEGFSEELSRAIAEMTEDDKTKEAEPPDFTESIKLGFEATKQLTTLNAGSIVIIGTFLSNIFPTDKQGTLTVPLYIKLLIGAAFVGFGASLIFAVFAMVVYRGLLEHHLGWHRPLTPFMRTERITIMLPLTFFSGGLICFGVAVLLNLFFGSRLPHSLLLNGLPRIPLLRTPVNKPPVDAHNPSGWHHGRGCRPTGWRNVGLARGELLCRQRRTWHWLGVSWRRE